MNTYVKTNGNLYPARVFGRVRDDEWDGRASKSIKLSMDADEARRIFVDGISWSIIGRDEDDGEVIETEYDNSEYCIAGDLTDHRDGTVTVKMGKLTDLEAAYEMMLGGNA